MIKILAYCLFLLVVLPSSAFSESTTATESNVPAVKKHKRQRVHIDRKDDELVIRNITIEIRDIFDEENPSAFYSTANQLKIKTKQDVVKRELLFKEGDKFNKFVVEESLRNLRQLSYVRNVSIKPTYGKDYVDVVISVQDTWTIFPFVSFSQGGGTKKQSFGITESNLLGYGKRLDVFYADEAGRKKIEGVYDDSRFLDTYNRLTVGLFERTDGYRSFVNLGKPFRSFIQTDSWKLDADLYNLVNKNYRHGEEKFLFREEHQDFSGGYTVAFGNAEKYVRRYTVGYDFYNADFSKASNQDVADVDSDPNQVITRRFILAPDRRFSGPFMALQYVEPDFVSMNYLDRFDRVEDYNLGNELLGRLTVAPDILGSFDNTLLMNLSDSDGLLLSEDSFFRGKVGGSSRLDDSGFRNSVYNLDLRYYNKLGDAKLDGIYFGLHTFAASLSAIFTYEYDRDKQLLVGNSTGLRGYKDFAFDGEQSLVMNFEERAFFVDDFYKLISVGSAFFYDVGGTSFNDFTDILKTELHSDVGFGLRFGFPRSSGGSVLRLDVAFPVNEGPDGSDAWSPRFIISAGQFPTANLPRESQQSQGSNVSLKFLP